ncbi:hypothetical protein J7E91_24905 [Streptomyces sp. ISL-99]|uniref:DUF6274 family protein n=1 Tax=Streptomyces sp. ISL-99 TaxID=2819193 RepID=UPI001BEA76DD|nr:DUF6274 family protein [Streptomyces sp. ISL-99]MBT2528557.1 hypothetical protein [Streptomyces sp. ISL-99]
MAASTARHETRALLRAHLAASTGYRHVTRHCPICHRLLRLAMEPEPVKPVKPARTAEDTAADESGAVGEAAASVEDVEVKNPPAP